MRITITKEPESHVYENVYIDGASDGVNVRGNRPSALLEWTDDQGNTLSRSLDHGRYQQVLDLLGIRR